MFPAQSDQGLNEAMKRVVRTIGVLELDSATAGYAGPWKSLRSRFKSLIDGKNRCSDQQTAWEAKQSVAFDRSKNEMTSLAQRTKELEESQVVPGIHRLLFSGKDHETASTLPLHANQSQIRNMEQVIEALETTELISYGSSLRHVRVFLEELLIEKQQMNQQTDDLKIREMRLLEELETQEKITQAQLANHPVRTVWMKTLRPTTEKMLTSFPASI